MIEFLCGWLVGKYVSLPLEITVVPSPLEEITCQLCHQRVLKHTDIAAGGGTYFTDLETGAMHPHAHD